MDNINNKIIKEIICEEFSKKNIILNNKNLFNLKKINKINNNIIIEILLNLNINSELNLSLNLENLENNTNQINIIIKANLQNNSRLNILLFLVNNKNLKIDIISNLLQENSQCDIKTLIFSDQDNKNILNSFQNHIGTNSKSSVITRRILTSNSQSEYYGKILISEPAINSDAFQEDSILVLSQNCKNISIPALEIKNNCVKCKHAFYVFKQELDSLIYLKSRGFDNLQIKKLLVNSFINNIFDNNKILKILDKI